MKPEPDSMTTFPRSQHWTIDGFRITVLVYDHVITQTCHCGEHR